MFKLDMNLRRPYVDIIKTINKTQSNLSNRASTEVPELKNDRLYHVHAPTIKKPPLVEHIMALKQLCFNNYARLCRFVHANNNKANIV